MHWLPVPVQEGTNLQNSAEDYPVYVDAKRLELSYSVWKTVTFVRCCNKTLKIYSEIGMGFMGPEISVFIVTFDKCFNKILQSILIYLFGCKFY